MSKYFEGLNYSLANEDTKIEFDLLNQNVKSVFSVCGSGSRVIPLLAKNPEEMHIVDLSETQLKLFRLRHAAIKNLDYEQYLYLLGYIGVSSHKASRKDLMTMLNLPSEDMDHWEQNQSFWENEGFIYLGKWERHFMKLGKYFQTFTLSNLTNLFTAKDFQDQQNMANIWKPWLFNLFSKIVMNEWVANKLLYKGSFAGGKDKKTTHISAADFVSNEFNDLFSNTFVRRNYFLTMIFRNRLTDPESFPIEAEKVIFEAVKKSQTKIFYYKENLLELLKKRPYEFYSLSDTFSYMSDAEVGGFIAELPPEVPAGAVMVIRTFMRKPSFKIDDPWVTDENQNLRLAKADCTRMYELTVLNKVKSV